MSDMKNYSWGTKSPATTLDYENDWGSRYLQRGQVLTSSTFEITTESDDGTLIIEDTSFSNTKATCVLSGGTAGKTYFIRNTVIYTGGLMETAKTYLICRAR